MLLVRWIPSSASSSVFCPWVRFLISEIGAEEEEGPAPIDVAPALRALEAHPTRAVERVREAVDHLGPVLLHRHLSAARPDQGLDVGGEALLDPRVAFDVGKAEVDQLMGERPVAREIAGGRAAAEVDLQRGAARPAERKAAVWTLELVARQEEHQAVGRRWTVEVFGHAVDRGGGPLEDLAIGEHVAAGHRDHAEPVHLVERDGPEGGQRRAVERIGRSDAAAPVAAGEPEPGRRPYGQSIPRESRRLRPEQPEGRREHADVAEAFGPHTALQIDHGLIQEEPITELGAAFRDRRLGVERRPTPCGPRLQIRHVSAPRPLDLEVAAGEESRDHLQLPAIRKEEDVVPKLGVALRLQAYRYGGVSWGGAAHHREQERARQGAADVIASRPSAV